MDTPTLVQSDISWVQEAGGGGGGGGHRGHQEMVPALAGH